MIKESFVIDRPQISPWGDGDVTRALSQERELSHKSVCCVKRQEQRWQRHARTCKMLTSNQHHQGTQCWKSQKLWENSLSFFAVGSNAFCYLTNVLIDIWHDGCRCSRHLTLILNNGLYTQKNLDAWGCWQKRTSPRAKPPSRPRIMLGAFVQNINWLTHKKSFLIHQH